MTKMLLPLCLCLTVSLSGQSPIDSLIGVQDYQAALDQLTLQGSTETIKVGSCLYRLGRWKEAKNVLEEITKRDTFHTQANVMLASIYDQEFELAKAILHYTRLHVTHPDNPIYLKQLGRLHVRAGLDRLAKDFYHKSRSLNPEDISVLLSLSELALKSKDWQHADSLANLALQLDSLNLQAILSSARCRYAFKDYQKTIDLLFKTRGRIDLTPFYAKMQGYSYLQLDSLDKSIHVLENLLYREASEHTHFYLALAYQEKGVEERALHHYEKAINQAISENVSKYYGGLARLYKKEGQTKEALVAYGEAFEYSGNPQYLFQKAQLTEAYYKDKRMALQEYRQCMTYKSLNREQVAFVNDRIRLLKEYLHQKGN